MDEPNEREIAMLEHMAILRRLLDIQKQVCMCLVVRLGGDVKLEHKELEYTRQNYTLIENIQVEDYMADIQMKVRLK